LESQSGENPRILTDVLNAFRKLFTNERKPEKVATENLWSKNPNVPFMAVLGFVANFGKKFDLRIFAELFKRMGVHALHMSPKHLVTKNKNLYVTCYLLKFRLYTFEGL